MQSEQVNLFRGPHGTAKQSCDHQYRNSIIFPVLQLQARSDIKRVRDSSRVQGQI